MQIIHTLQIYKKKFQSKPYTEKQSTSISQYNHSKLVFPYNRKQDKLAMMAFLFNGRTPPPSSRQIFPAKKLLLRLLQITFGPFRFNKERRHANDKERIEKESYSNIADIKSGDKTFLRI